LLDDSRTIADASAAGDITDLDFDEVTTPQLAVDGKVEQRSIAQTLDIMLIRKVASPRMAKRQADKLTVFALAPCHYGRPP
jgi:hypothetical protein